MGFTIGNMLDLETLAENCTRDGVYEFMLVAGPLPVTGPVGGTNRGVYRAQRAYGGKHEHIRRQDLLAG